MVSIAQGRRGWILAVLFTLAVGGASFLPVCNWCFDCGCVTLWSGAAAHCDIHTPGAPDCPWCHHAWMGYAAMILASAAAVAAIWRLRAAHWLAMTGSGLLAFHAALFAIGAVTALAMGTPVFAGLR